MPKSLADKLFRRNSKRRMRKQFALHADPRRFEIDWRSINFNRIAVANLLLSDKPEARYLEIGCAGNEMFDAVMAKHKIGVDPAHGGTHRMTSDEFFSQNGGATYDVVFIDGLHLYEQAHRDVANALRCVGPNGWIALHDMWPRDWLEEHVPRVSSAWTGDVWKVAFELAKSPGLDFRLLQLDMGVGVLRVLKAGAQLPDLRSELADRRFPYFMDHFNELPVLAYPAAREWMAQGLLAARLDAKV